MKPRFESPPIARGMRRLVGALAILWISACASVDFDYPKAPSSAITDLEGTSFAGVVGPRVAAHPNQSGFLLLYDGIDALAVRLLIADRAEKTIDAQYYLITNDTIGYVFIGSLLLAADRGVRVRLLLDDIQTAGYDTGMAALDSHPNFEVRIFNPFAGRKSRIGDGLTSFSRVNRRMHNKSFTIDNQITLIGGRNIADEYYGAHGAVNFGDVDVLAIGPVVRDVSNMFDMYWNHEAAAPVPAFADMPDDPDAALVQLRARIESELQAVNKTEYAEAIGADFQKYEDSTLDIFTWAEFELVYDSPDKVDKKKAVEGEIQTITSRLAAAVDRAATGLIVISPYFVPGRDGVDYFRSLRDRGIDVTIITNSLAATNHSIVHSGYAPSRKALLEMGVKIHEFRFTGGLEGIERGGSGSELATLHTKAFVVDCRDLFVGSFNWDPRSIDINTELGVIIESPELAGEACALIAQALDEKSYEVVLNERGQLRWIDRSGPEPTILDKEPDTSFWTRFSVGLMKALPIRGQL
jgi:putative cardiolipin synthase